MPHEQLFRKVYDPFLGKCVRIIVISEFLTDMLYSIYLLLPILFSTPIFKREKKRKRREK